MFFDNEANDSPPFATLFALNMLLTREHGSVRRGPAAGSRRRAENREAGRWLLPAKTPEFVAGTKGGISLLDALLVARQGGVVAAWLVSAGFLPTLFLQRYVRGT